MASELTRERVHELVQEYLRESLKESEDWRVCREPMSEESLEGQLHAYDYYESEYRRDLALSNYRKISKDVDRLVLEPNGLLGIDKDRRAGRRA